MQHLPTVGQWVREKASHPRTAHCWRQKRGMRMARQSVTHCHHCTSYKASSRTKILHPALLQLSWPCQSFLFFCHRGRTPLATSRLRGSPRRPGSMSGQAFLSSSLLLDCREPLGTVLDSDSACAVTFITISHRAQFLHQLWLRTRVES